MLYFRHSHCTKKFSINFQLSIFNSFSCIYFRFYTNKLAILTASTQTHSMHTILFIVLSIMMNGQPIVTLNFLSLTKTLAICFKLSVLEFNSAKDTSRLTAKFIQLSLPRLELGAIVVAVEKFSTFKISFWK